MYIFWYEELCTSAVAWKAATCDNWHPICVLVHVPAVSVLVQLHANVEKAAEYCLTPWTAPMLGDL